jgi:hypothetical protein
MRMFRYVARDSAQKEHPRNRFTEPFNLVKLFGLTLDFDQQGYPPLIQVQVSRHVSYVRVGKEYYARRLLGLPACRTRRLVKSH